MAFRLQRASTSSAASQDRVRLVTRLGEKVGPWFLLRPAEAGHYVRIGGRRQNYEGRNRTTPAFGVTRYITYELPPSCCTAIFCVTLPCVICTDFHCAGTL